MGETQETGSWGEERALEEGLRRGWRLVARNVRCGRGEIDLVFQDGETLVFVEVKARRAGPRAGLLAVHPHKQRRLVLAARYFLASHPQRDELLARFDVCVISPGPTVTWVEDAFQVA